MGDFNSTIDIFKSKQKKNAKSSVAHNLAAGFPYLTISPRYRHSRVAAEL